MNKTIIAIAILILSAQVAAADTYVRGYMKSNGTYVQPHYRSDANGTTLDNWSTKGNVNPYTGQYGTRPAYPSAPSYEYNQPTTMFDTYKPSRQYSY